MGRIKVLLIIIAIFACGYFGWENIDENYTCSQCGARRQVVKKYLLGVKYKVKDNEWSAPIKEYDIIRIPHNHIYSGYGFGRENWGLMGDYIMNIGNANKVECLAYDLCRYKLIKNKYVGDIKSEYLSDVNRFINTNEVYLWENIKKIVNE